MGFRPNCFTCIAHLYLYYILFVPHTYASYIRHWCIFFHWEIKYKTSSIFNMVSEPLLWPFLSSLVFISVTPFFNIASAITTTATAFRRWTSDVTQPSSLGSEPTAAVIKEFHTAQTTIVCITATNIAPITVLKVPQRSSCADLQNRESLNAVGDRTHPHTSPKVSGRLITRHHAPVLQITRSTRLLTSLLTSSTSAFTAPLLTSPDCVSRWRHPLTLGIWPLTSRLNVDFDRVLTLTVRWLFSKVDFFCPGAPYPIFRVDFIFVVYFCIFCF